MIQRLTLSFLCSALEISRSSLKVSAMFGKTLTAYSQRKSDSLFVLYCSFMVCWYLNVWMFAYMMWMSADMNRWCVIGLFMMSWSALVAFMLTGLLRWYWYHHVSMRPKFLACWLTLLAASTSNLLADGLGILAGSAVIVAASVNNHNCFHEISIIKLDSQAHSA